MSTYSSVKHHFYKKCTLELCLSDKFRSKKGRVITEESRVQKVVLYANKRVETLPRNRPLGGFGRPRSSDAPVGPETIGKSLTPEVQKSGRFHFHQCPRTFERVGRTSLPGKGTYLDPCTDVVGTGDDTHRNG